MQIDDELDFTMRGVLDIENDDVRARITYRRFPDLPPGTRVDMITVDEIDYFRPQGTRRWVKTETSEDDAVANALDVPSSLGSLGAVSEDVERIGRERLAGVQTTRYSATVDTDRVAEALPDDEAERYRSKIKPLQGDELPMGAWIDGEGMIRRVGYRMSVPRAGAERIVVKIDLSDFGLPVDIEPPPAALTDSE